MNMLVNKREQLLQLRLIVGFLGERSQFNWWPTAFFEASSQSFLEPVFSRTVHLARYHAVLEAAKQLHDNHLNMGCFHLFRLPEEVEQDLHILVKTGFGKEVAVHISDNQERALVLLSQISDKKAHVNEGPVAVGSILNLDSTETLNAIAAAYQSAFMKDTKTFPYLVS